METFSEFLERINQFERAKLALPETDSLPGISVVVKVHPDNSFCDFYGDTVVFDLEEEDKIRLGSPCPKAL